VKATPNISLAVPTSTPTKPELEGSSAGDARRGALEEEENHRRKSMEAPGTKKPENNLTQTLSEAMKDLNDTLIMDPTEGKRIIHALDSLIENTLRRNEMNMPFYKRWYLWYRHWKLQRKYRNVQKL
jgi:hypothetical protein